MTERIVLKEEKEAFVSNLPGGPISEINSVTVVALVHSPSCSFNKFSRRTLYGQRYKHGHAQPTADNMDWPRSVLM